MTELSNITTLLSNAFEKNAWHGPSVKEAIKGITQEQSLKRLNNTHSIIELVTHITSWRVFIINKLKGNTNFKMTDELNFPAETNWESAVKKLEESQQQLLLSIENFSDNRLQELVPSSKHQYTYYTLLHGTIHHDLYHTGQIAIIKKHFGF